VIPISKPQIDRREIEAVEAVLQSGRLAQGPRVAEFEERFAEFVGARYGVACGNGTQALMLALLAHGIGPGDEVITTPFTFVATASAVMMCGARPVFVDVLEGTGNINPQAVQRALWHDGRPWQCISAVIPVHLFGHPVDDYNLTRKICTDPDRRDIGAAYFPDDGLSKIRALDGAVPVPSIIYDSCQAHSAMIADACLEKRPMGWLGTSCFSFYATKNLTTGEGGMVITNDADMADYLRSLRNHGQTKRYHYTELGYNFRMTEIQAAIGLVQLEKLPEMQAARQQNATYLTENLEGVITPIVRPGCVHAWHQYTIRVPGGREKRDALQAHLTEQGIGSGVYYPLPLHLQPAFAHLGYKIGDFPIAEKLSGEVLSLPVHPGLSSEDLERIAEGVNGWQR